MADYYITGSDQVWGGMLPANYLTFVNDDDKKVAYAASFGKSEISSEHAQKVKPWVKAFKHISVREESGVGICESLAHIAARSSPLVKDSQQKVDIEPEKTQNPPFFG